MYYQVTVAYNQIQRNGTVKRRRAQVITDVDLFSEAEFNAMEHFKDQDDLDVVAAKRLPRLKEIANDINNGEQFFMATLSALFVDEKSGKETKTKYDVLVSADHIDDAHRIIREYMKQGLQDLLLEEIKSTPIVDII
jgi:hypothetical protein